MAINIKKIKSLKAFCGLDTIEMGEFKHYNVIFGNNGCGKTSLTRAFELLIPKNKHIEKYRTISADKSPSIEFECEDGSYKIEPNSDIGVPPFKVEIYNSDFLHNNAPLNSEFGLKKLDDGTIILEGSVLGEETKEINQLKDFREKVEKRQKKIKDENDIENTLIAKQKSEIKKYDEEIEKIRKKMTSKTIQIALDEIGINDFCKVSKDKFKYQEDALTDLEKDFNKLNEAMKKFDGLKEMELPKDYQTIKDKLEFLFSFNIDKEAGQVSEKIKEHISKVGREFIEKGIKLQKEMPDNACPFCAQKIPNEIIQEYTSYFNKSVETFNQRSLEMSGTLKNILDQWNIKEILQSFEKFEPFMKKDFSKNKESLENALEQIKVLLEKLQKEVDKKEGAKNKEKFQEIDKELLEIQKDIQQHVDETRKILNEKKKQKEKLEKLKTELKEARIKKVKHDSYDWQKSKREAERKLSVLNRGHERLNRLLEKIDNKLKKLYEQKRPDIEAINSYLKALNLPKYSLHEDYRIVLNSNALENSKAEMILENSKAEMILENSEAEMILSGGEKTTLAFAYFLARLKLFYKKEDLKDLVVIIDDPISSLDEQRIYNTSDIVAKINQELAGEALKDEDKAQVFVLTHNHTFMARLINMVGKHARYFQLERNQNQLKIVCKNEVVGYFDTFYLLLFKEVYEFAKKEKVQDDCKEAINYGNKVRILLESFLKINFIDSFLAKKHDGVFKEDMLKHLIETANGEVELNFSKLPFNKDNNCHIENEEVLRKKILHIAKGLHLDSHGSVVDFFRSYKIPLENIQEFAKIAINAMKILNPYQTRSYMGSVDKETKNKE
ncbi:AAA family ATPase [Helicobacter pylori]|uniref:AAA family ATPase n=1 Tax=Helicobacter pylori TaxID=210 RepID=UPI00165B4999|nr:AAA family ATPase [Helicobacter pylori]